MSVNRDEVQGGTRLLIGLSSLVMPFLKMPTRRPNMTVKILPIMKLFPPSTRR